VPRYAPQIPILAAFYRREQSHYAARKGMAFDFGRAYWLPPLPPEAVISSERKRVQEEFQISAIVSISDHDHISIVDPFPPSLEWSIVVDGVPLHLGIYNIPLHKASDISSKLLRQTEPRDQSKITEVLTWLNEYKDILVVLNHPFADIGSRGPKRVKRAVVQFLRNTRGLTHALEINGDRPWRENREVALLAKGLGLALVGGGDRHGCSPNAILSLTDSLTLSEFVQELRNDKRSVVLITQEYTRNLAVRRLQSAVDFFRSCQDPHPAGQHWMNRVFFKTDEGLDIPLSYYWKRTIPLWIRSATWFLEVLASRWVWPGIRSLFRSNEISYSSLNTPSSIQQDDLSVPSKIDT